MSSPPAPTDISFEELYRRLDEAAQALARDAEASPEERRAILAARAAALSQARARQQQDHGVQLLAFRVGGERYALPVAQVDGVLEIRGLSPLLGAPRSVLGALAARGRVIAVLDLRQLLGLSGGGMSDLTKVVVATHAGELFGLAIEEIEGRLELPRDGWRRPDAGPFLHISGDRLAVLDLDQLGQAPAAPAHS